MKKIFLVAFAACLMAVPATTSAESTTQTVAAETAETVGTAGTAGTAAQTSRAVTGASTARGNDTILIRRMVEVDVMQRSLRDIGVTKTVLDSVALRDNVTNSLADVLSQSTSIFIKSYGRSSMSSASFRGTAPSHTQVTWNDIKLNSPMLGMVDFSMIPSFFIDNVEIFHGAGSVGVAGGGLGGAVSLGTMRPPHDGPGLTFIQGVGSYKTFDEFLKFTYGTKKWSSSTRAYYVTSDNDFRYRNYKKDGYPTERNLSGMFRDFHVLQEFFFRPSGRDNFNFSAWYLDSDRGVPLINVKYNGNDSKSNQVEKTLRAIAGWDRFETDHTLSAKAGYVYSNMIYRSFEDNQQGPLAETLHAQSFVHTGFAKASAEYHPGRKLHVTASLSAYLHSVESRQLQVNSIIPYDKTRAEIALLVTAKYRPTERLGLGLDLREESYGKKFTPLIPAAFVDYVLWRRYNVAVKASTAKNYRYPTLNDMYFLPGGNASLKPESGFTYDIGIEAGIRREKFTLTGEATWYDSQIKNWIVWLPVRKSSYWTPVNVKQVHSYGVELKGKFAAELGRGWNLYVDTNWSRTRSINHGDPMSWTDESLGKQLVYVPEFSTAVTGRLSWHAWSLIYKYNYYSTRYVTSSNETHTSLYTVAPYYMSDVALERRLSFPFAELSVKVAVNNLFDEEYESVLARPMPGRNYGLYIGIAPKFGKR